VTEYFKKSLIPCSNSQKKLIPFTDSLLSIE
jgi:hypothetical protein